jgi:hypothetical protein
MADRTGKVVNENEGGVSTALVHPAADGFIEKVTPKQVDENTVFLYTCSCGNSHFRHAGYVELMLPFLEPGKKEVCMQSHQVKVCTKCKKSFAWISGQAYDLTGKIDLEAWERTEKELHKATGPGGEC